MLTDASGNSDSCSFYITILDSIAPVIDECLMDTVIVFPDDSCHIIVPDFTELDFSFSDNCSSKDNILIAQLPIAGTSVNEETLMTLYLTDESGNVSSCQFLLEVEDQTKPVITNCILDTVIYPNYNCEYVMGDYMKDHLITVNDNCSSYLYNNIETKQIPTPGTLVTTDTMVFIVASDYFGNVDTCSFYVSLKSCGIKINESFSPNGDGQNETFFIENLDLYPNTSLIIYNRWGTKIYESDDYKN